MISRRANTKLRRLTIALWVAAGLGVIWLGWTLAFTPPPDNTPQEFAEPGTTQVFERPGGHAYQYIRNPDLSWDAANAAAQKLTHKGRRGYLATINDKDEFTFVMSRVFPEATDVVYLGGRQTAPSEWRWVTGPDASEDGGKGRLFWTGYARGAAPDGAYADWIVTAFQHGGKWDVSKVCCVTLFSYRKRQFSTALGNGDPEEGVAGYLVEFSKE